MSNEAHKGLVRILSNYTRLLITLGLGLLVVPLTLNWLGDEAFGLISLLGANIGLAGIFRQIIQMSLIRELGQAYHADDETFRKGYTTICMISFVCTILSILSFSAVFALLPIFQISDEYLAAARWFIFGQGVYTAVMVILAPILNMYLVKERFIGYNIWYIGVRAGNILSVLILGYVFVIDDPALGLTIHGLLWSSLSILGMVIAAIAMVKSDRRLKLRLERSDKETRDKIFSTFSWNTGVQVAMNLHEQIPPLLLNLFFGPIANAAWGIGFRFVAYIRQATAGVQFGSDAVSARMASGDDSEESRRKLQRLVSIQTKMTAMIALPAAAGVIVFGWPIFDIWVGGALESYEEVMPIAVYMSRILAIAFAARTVSDAWLIVLYGAGYVKSYAPFVFVGGLCAPIASIVLMFTLPDSMIMYAPAAVFASVLVGVHLFGLPFITGKCLHINPMSLILALVPPVISIVIAMSCAIGLLYFTGHISDLGFTGAITYERGQTIDRFSILASIGVFAAVYAIASYILVLESSERARIISLIRR